MALPALALASDVADRLGRPLTVGAETTRTLALLGDASEKVRKYTGQQFSRVTDDVVLLRINRASVTLPQRPADKPTNIAYADGVGVIPTAAWWWGGLDSVDFMPPPWLGNGPAFVHLRKPTTVAVTYSHGFTVIPADVLGIVCAMVVRVIATGLVMPGLREGGLDDFKFVLGGTLTTGGLQLTADEKTELDPYKRRTWSRVFR